MMRSLLLKDLLFFSSSSLSSSSHAILLRLQHCNFSSSPPPQPYWRRQEEESRNVRVCVWWDFENCQVPLGVNVLKVAPAITDVVRANGIKGPIHITAFGNVMQLSRANQEALSYTGIHLTHIPNDGKNSADRSLLVDLMYWVSQNPPPAHLFLISGDRDFAGMLHRLRMNNYNILLAIPGKAPDALCSAATIMWQWSSLLKGEELTGKHFNHPPDGPYSSWYGTYKVPIENPFSSVEQSTSSQNVEVYEPSSDLKIGPVPKPVARQVRQILSQHPSGISITDLRTELEKCGVPLEKKNLYGYKRFTRFLVSIPQVQLRPLGNGNFCVCMMGSKSPELSKSSAVPSTSVVENEEGGYEATPKQKASLYERNMDDDSKSFQSVPSQGKNFGECVDGKSSSLGSEKVVDVANAQLLEIQLPTKDNEVSKTKSEVSKTKTSSLKMRSKNLHDNEIVRSDDVSPKILEKYTTSGNDSAENDHTTAESNGFANCESGKLKAKNEYRNPIEKEVNEVCHGPDSSPVDDSPVVEKRPDASAETYRSPTFFSWIKSWWPFWRNSARYDDSTAHQNKVLCHFEDPTNLSEEDQTVGHFKEPKLSELDQDVNHSARPESFSNCSFWNDMECFVFSPRGSHLFSHSKSRGDIAIKLQKDGPPVVRFLSENDIFQLVELLITEKKWLEESPSQAFPFRLTQPVQKRSLMGQSNGANDSSPLFLRNDANCLSSLFQSKTSRTQSNLQKSFEHDVEKYNHSVRHTRVSTPATGTKQTERTRDDILVDCQKLVREILREHPEGYNIGSFPKQFVDRYGYYLDVLKLGYPKLASLLLIMPGVKLESTYMFPSAICDSDGENSMQKTRVTNASHAVSNSDDELTDSAAKDEDDTIESQWEELGPVAVNNSDQRDLESKSRQKAKELDTSKLPYYEPIDPDYDSSESEEDDSSCLAQPEKQRKPKCDEQESSLWQALDSLHSNKEGENSIKKSASGDTSPISLADILNSPTESTWGTSSKIPSGNYRETRRYQKKYSFVADPDLPNNEKLIDGIIDGLKKLDESKV